MKIVRRLGSTPTQRGCHSNATCPDVFELADGRYAVIGTNVDPADVADLLPDARVGPDELLVIVPRDVLVRALADVHDDDDDDDLKES